MKLFNQFVACTAAILLSLFAPEQVSADSILERAEEILLNEARSEPVKLISSLQQALDEAIDEKQSGNCTQAAADLEDVILSAHRTERLYQIISGSLSDRSQDARTAAAEAMRSVDGIPDHYSMAAGFEAFLARNIIITAALELSECRIEMEQYDTAINLLENLVNSIPLTGLRRDEARPDDWVRALMLLYSVLEAEESPE